MPSSPAVKPAKAMTATTMASFLYGFFRGPALACPTQFTCSPLLMRRPEAQQQLILLASSSCATLLGRMQEKWENCRCWN